MVTTTPTPSVDFERFETIYTDAHGDPSQVPWADSRPHPGLVAWLNAIAPSVVRCGSRVAVVGCGLGHDAAEIDQRGYEVTAFDCAPTAIDWAKRLHPASAGCFHVADLFDLPSRWRGRFDLVVEINTIQALPPERRPETTRAIADLVSPRGSLLVICRAATSPVSADDGPPWALTQLELGDHMLAAGFAPRDGICCYEDNETPPVQRLRALFTRTNG